MGDRDHVKLQSYRKIGAIEFKREDECEHHARRAQKRYQKSNRKEVNEKK